jgi:hypothetical protein
MTVTRSALFFSTDITSTMKAYIREHFADMLGAHASLLDRPDGLDQLADLVRTGQISGARQR